MRQPKSVGPTPARLSVDAHNAAFSSLPDCQPSAGHRAQTAAMTLCASWQVRAAKSAPGTVFRVNQTACPVMRACRSHFPHENVAAFSPPFPADNPMRVGPRRHANRRAFRRGPIFFAGQTAQQAVLRVFGDQTPEKFACRLPTSSTKAKPRYLLDSRVSFVYLGWLMGLEPTTTGITILDSTN